MNAIRLFFVLAPLLTGLTPAFAQALPDDSGLTLELVEARIRALRNADSPEGGTTDGGKTTLDVYREVRNQLTKAEAHAAAEKSYTQALTEAPQQEAGIRARMDSGNYRSSDIDPQTVSEMDQASIESSLTELRVRMRDAMATKENIDRRIASEQTSTADIRVRLEAIDKRLAELAGPEVTVQRDLTPSDYEAGQWERLAENSALVAERRMLEARLASQPVRFSRRKVESDELAMVIEGLQYQLQALEAELADRSKQEDEQSILELDADTAEYATVQRIRQENEELRQRFSELNAVLAYMEEQHEKAGQKQIALAKQFETVQQIVELADGGSTLGHLLMTQWHQREQFHHEDIELGDAGRIGNHVIRRAQFEEELAELTNATEYATSLLAEGLPEEVQLDENSLKALIQLARAKRSLLTDLIAIEIKLINSHGSFDRVLTQLNSQLDQYEQYLGSRILWVPSHPPISASFWANIKHDYVSYRRSLSGIGYLQVAPAAGLAALLGLLWFLFREKFHRYASAQRAKLGRVNQDSIGLTFVAMLFTILRSLAIPALLLVLAHGISSGGHEMAPYLGSSMNRSAKILFLLLLLRNSCESGGLAQLHFNWPQNLCANIRNLSTTLLVWAWPLMLLTSYLFRVEVDSINIVLGRLVFTASMVAVIAILLHDALHRRRSRNPLSRMEAAFYLVIVTACIFLVVTAMMGYIYTGYVLDNGLINTLLLGIALAFFYGVLKRWLVLANRRWRYQQWLDSSKAADREDSGEDSWEDDNLSSLSASAGQFLKAGTILLALLGLAYLWAPLFKALEAMQRVTLWTVDDVQQGEAIITSITLASVALAMIVAVTTYSAARTIPRFLAVVLYGRATVTTGTRYAVAKLSQYLITGVGIIIFLSILGLKWDRLQWLVAALGVGIGFGLQEIIANFISGLIILFERPVRVGDFVTVGESSGKVVKIRIRATTIRDFQGKELLVPNKEFVTGRLLNWTLSDPKIRVDFDVGIAYGSDARRAAAVIEEVLLGHPKVLKDPAPFVMFGQFGDSSLNLKAMIFTADVDHRLGLTSELHHLVYEKLAEEGIVIAFPQLDVHLNPAPATHP